MELIIEIGCELSRALILVGVTLRIQVVQQALIMGRSVSQSAGGTHHFAFKCIFVMMVVTVHIEELNEVVKSQQFDQVKHVWIVLKSGRNGVTVIRILGLTDHILEAATAIAGILVHDSIFVGLIVVEEKLKEKGFETMFEVK